MKGTDHKLFNSHTSQYIKLCTENPKFLVSKQIQQYTSRPLGALTAKPSNYQDMSHPTLPQTAQLSQKDSPIILSAQMVEGQTYIHIT